MATSHLKPENLKKLFDASVTYMEDLRRPFDELERIRNNRPHPNIDPAYPTTTDGTTASQIRLAPRRSVQQIPYGKVEVDGDEALTCLADYILQEEIIPNSTTQDDVLGKIWHGVEDIETFGSTDALVFYKVEGQYFGTDWRIPYKKDVYLESGKGTFNECNYVFVRAWYQDTDIQNIIDREAQLAKSAKKRGEKYETTWDIPALQKLLKEGNKQEKDQRNKTDVEKDRKIKANGYEFIHAYQKGQGAYFYTFSLSGDEEATLRKWKNPDPRGYLPVERMYFENDLSNPEGRGIVELVAPLQNYLDSSLQSIQYVKALMYNPPLLKKGVYNRGQIKFAPNAIIDLGSDPNSSLAPLNLSTSAITNFSNDFGLIKSQILNLFGGDDQSVSATVGNPGFSKTDAGVNARQAIIGVNDNFIRKRVEDWVGRIWETQLNIYFQLTEGDREFTVDEDEMEKLMEYTDSPYFTIVEDGKIIIHFSEITDKIFKFETEASTTKAPDTNEAKEHFLEALKSAAEIGLGQYINPQEATKRLLVQAGVDDPEKLLVDPAQQQMVADPMTGQPMDPSMDPNTIPQEQMQQQAPQMSPEDEQILNNLVSSGYTPELAVKALTLEKQGYSPDQIDQALQGGM